MTKCQHLEDLQDLVNQYFPNDQRIMLQKSRVKDLLRVQDRSLPFSVQKVN